MELIRGVRPMTGQDIEHQDDGELCPRGAIRSR